MNRHRDLTTNHIFSLNETLSSIRVSLAKDMHYKYFHEWNKKPSIEHDSNDILQGNADMRRFKKFYYLGKTCECCGATLTPFDAYGICRDCDRLLVERENMRRFKTKWNQVEKRAISDNRIW